MNEFKITVMKRKKSLTLSNTKHLISKDQFRELKLIFQNYANEPVQKILGFIRDRERTVTEIYVMLRCDQATASGFLKKLRTAKIVKSERQGKFFYYSIDQFHEWNLLNVSELLCVGDLKKTIELFRVLSRGKSIPIVQFLLKNSGCIVQDIYRTLGYEQSVTSQTLAQLRKVGVVRFDRIGKNVYYEVNEYRLNNIINHCSIYFNCRDEQKTKQDKQLSQIKK